MRAHLDTVAIFVCLAWASHEVDVASWDEVVLLLGLTGLLLWHRVKP